MIYSRSQVKKAGKILKDKESYAQVDITWAEDVLTYWRTLHGKVINDFHKIVLTEVQNINADSFVAQRIKRAPSIIGKLKRPPGNNQLTTMQDIAGVRAVVANITEVKKLVKKLKSSIKIHEFRGEDDYLKNPKESGYRSVHLIYKYNDTEDSDSNGLLIEIQIRTKLQHAWATSVETMGTFLGSQFKFNEGQPKWLKYFALTSSAFSFLEGTNRVPKYEKLGELDTFVQAVYEFNYNKIDDNLRAYSIVTNLICKETDNNGKLHLVILNIDKKEVSVESFNDNQFQVANEKYTEAERIAQGNQSLQVVLVSTESIHELRDAFPNYFLDTREFLKHMDLIKSRIEYLKTKK
jgi:putative GTP pyrophosphokinase